MTGIVKITDREGIQVGQIPAKVGMITRQGKIGRVTKHGTVFVDGSVFFTGYRPYDGNYVTMSPSDAAKYGFKK